MAHLSSLHNYAEHVFCVIMHYENQEKLPKNLNKYQPNTKTQIHHEYQYQFISYAQPKHQLFSSKHIKI